MLHICIFMKKNTLLYLDSTLVEKAKAANLNISQFVEKKLIEELRTERPKLRVNTSKELLPILFTGRHHSMGKHISILIK